ncbi:hypothetical protein [Brevundimonas sp. PWP3-1b1]|uniref:hypothetical protein n=1 Tax=unclassified Brevundimonas TaxID=2622653 RepID=UPI003CE9A4FE
MRLKAFAVSTALTAALLGACATAAPAQGVFAQQAEPAVTVTRDGDDWTADYVFDRDAPVWAFMDSALITEVRQPWRQSQWTVQTPGVVMERRGAYDILRSVDGGPVPRRVRFSIRPRAVDLEAQYGTLTFSDGAVALPTRQFDVFPLPSVAAAQAMPADLNGVDLAAGPSRVTWRDTAGPVLFNGKRRPNLTTTDERSYVLLGQARVTPGDGLTTVMDPNLPSWIGEEIRGFAPHVGDYYRNRLGDPGVGSETSTVMVSWNGPTERMSSMGGSVLPGLIVMQFEGVGVMRPNQEMLERSRWFIGHESAHFWLGQAVRYEYARDMWITEGGADLMAVRALKALDPTYDARAELQKEVDDCIDLSAGRAVVTAAERGEHRAYYACGAVFAMAAEGAQNQRSGGDWFDFLRPLLAANRQDGVLTRAEWLDALTRVSRDPTLANDISGLLDRGASDPAAVVARLFQRTGVGFRREGGRIILN